MSRAAILTLCVVTPLACGGPEARTDEEPLAPITRLKVATFQATFVQSDGELRARRVVRMPRDRIADVRAFRTTLTKVGQEMQLTQTDVRYFGCRLMHEALQTGETAVEIACPVDRPDPSRIWDGEGATISVFVRSDVGNTAVSRPLWTSLVATPWGYRAEVDFPKNASEVASFGVFLRRSARTPLASATAPKQDLASYGCRLSIISGVGLARGRLRVLCRNADMPTSRVLSSGDGIELRYVFHGESSRLQPLDTRVELRAKSGGVRATGVFLGAVDGLVDIRAYAKVRTFDAEGHSTDEYGDLTAVGCTVTSHPVSSTMSSLEVDCDDAQMMGGVAVPAGRMVDLMAVRESSLALEYFEPHHLIAVPRRAQKPERL